MVVGVDDDGDDDDSVVASLKLRKYSYTLLSTYTSPSSANNTAFGSRSSSSSARSVFETVLFEQTVVAAVDVVVAETLQHHF